MLILEGQRKMEIQDKENICQFEKTVIDVNMVSRTPLRTPLLDINNQTVLNKSIKKTVLSHISAESTTRTPTRKPQKLRKSLLVCQDKENLPDDGISDATSIELVSAPVCVIPATAAYDKTTTHSNKDSLNEHVITSGNVPQSNNTQPTIGSFDTESGSIHYFENGDEQANTKDSETSNEKCEVINVEKLQTLPDFDIYFNNEEVCGIDISSVENSLLIPSNENDFCNVELSPMRSVESNNTGIDHTYAGIKCNLWTDNKINACDLGTSPMTPLLQSSVETFTEEPSLMETACSPITRESKDTGTMAIMNTNDVGSSPCHACEQLEQETMTDPMTPVNVPETCDASIQHLIDTVTTACSPMPSQLTADYNNAACSPIPSQLTANYSDVGSSPAFVSQTTETSTMTNANPVKHDMALQAVPTTMSVLCSPLRMPTVECGISAVLTQSDVTTNTVIVEQMDQGVDVRPMMTAGSTMTEYLLVNSETSMTPVKLLNKKGHRITAEEIRRQHPRILANKMDTYALEAERYKQDIGKVEKERDRFKSQITELKSAIKEKQKIINDSQGAFDREKKELKEQHEEKIDNLNTRLQEIEENNKDLKEEINEMKRKSSEEQDQYMTEIRDLTTKCAEFEVQLKDSTQIKSREIETLKEEIERRQNDHQMKSAHNLILELQTELAEYKDLTDSLQLAEKLQSEIQNVVSDNYRKVRAAADRLMNMKRNLDIQRLDVVQQKCENEKDAERLAGEKTEMTDKYDSLKCTLETSRSSMMQIESLYESTSADLLSATNQVQILSNELMTTRSAFEELTVIKGTLIQQVEDLQENDMAAVQEITNLRQMCQIKEIEYKDLRKYSVDKEKNLNTKIEILKEEKDRLDLLAINLQHTVDSLNEDIDTLENDLFALREFSLEQASRIVKIDEELTTSNSELTQVKQENMELRDSLAVFRGNQDYLQESIDVTQRDLQRTSLELNDKTAELRESTYLVVELENKMAGLLHGLRNRSGLEKVDRSVLRSPQSSYKNIMSGQSTQKSSKKNLKRDVPNSSRKVHCQSFLSMVIRAAEGQSDSEYESCNSSPCSKSFRSVSPYIEGIVPLEEEMSTICEKLKDRDSIEEESPSAASRNKLGSSTSNSAFAPVRTGTSAIKSKPRPLDSTIKNVSVMSQSQLEDSNLRLSEQIDCMGETFSEIIRCASIIEKASKLSIADLQLENEELCQQLEECQTSERTTQEELTMKTSQLSESEEKIAALTENITNLSNKIGYYVQQETEMNNLKSEIVAAKSEIKQLEAEKEILSNQLKEVLNGVKEDSAQPGNFVRYHSDITTLKLKIQKLKGQLKQREEYNEALAIKATKRMKTLDENWKKAEEEVYKFDHLVDTIREALINSGLILKHKESLGRIIRMIDGFESVPSNPAPLQPVKTALW